MQFGDATNGNILLNFDTSNILVACAQALMSVHVALAFPVIVFPLLPPCLVLLRLVFPSLAAYSNQLRHVTSFVVIFVSASLAIFVNVETVFSLCGAYCGALTSFTIPGLAARELRWSKLISWALVVVGVAVTIIGTYDAAKAL